MATEAPLAPTVLIDVAQYCVGRLRLLFWTSDMLITTPFHKPKKGKLLCWCCEAPMCIGGELSKCLKLFAFQEFVCKCSMSLSTNNVSENRAVKIIGCFLNEFESSFMWNGFWTLTDRLYTLPWFRAAVTFQSVCWLKCCKPVWLEALKQPLWELPTVKVWSCYDSTYELCVKSGRIFSRWKPLNLKSPPIKQNQRFNICVKELWSLKDDIEGVVKMKIREKHKLVSLWDQTMIRLPWWRRTFFHVISPPALLSVFSLFGAVCVSKIARLEKWTLEFCCYFFSIWPLNSFQPSLVESNDTMSTRASCQDIYAARQWGRSPSL